VEQLMVLMAQQTQEVVVQVLLKKVILLRLVLGEMVDLVLL
jgi:hypothetical protein